MSWKQNLILFTGRPKQKTARLNVEAAGQFTWSSYNVINIHKVVTYLIAVATISTLTAFFT